jgi:hypothetical protein
MTTLTDDELHDLENPPDPVPPAAEGSSLLDRLKAERDDIANDQQKDFELPNNGGLLWATYRVLPWKRVNAVAMQVQQNFKSDPESVLRAAASQVAEACVEVWLRDPVTGERTPWPGGAEQVRYEQRLLDFLSEPVPARTSGDVVRAVLAVPPKEAGGEPRDMAVTAHHAELSRWMRDAHGSANDVFAGG